MPKIDGNTDLSLIFPCYLDAEHLEANLDRVLRLLGLLNLSYEVILVDDASPDGSQNLITNLIEKRGDHKVRAVFHPENQGRGAAFMSGFKESKGRIVGFIDIDFEVSPIYLFECISKIRNEGADLVLGKRHYKLNHDSLFRHILSSGYARLASLLLSIPYGLDSETGYKFFRREALAKYAGLFQHTGWFWDTEVVCRFIENGHKIQTIPCLFIRKPEKGSTVRPIRDSIYYFKQLLSFSSAKRKRLNGFIRHTSL